MAEEEEKPVFSDRIKQLLTGRKWQTQELKLKRTKTPKVGVVDEDGNKETVSNSTFHKRLIRKCEFPHTEAAAEMVDFLSSDKCLEYLKFCRKELNATIGEGEDSEYEWIPVQAWFSEEDAANGHARRGMLYQVLKHKSDSGFGDGPYVTTDGCKYQEEYTFFWDVDEPPKVPASRSGVQYSLDIKRRDDADGMDGLYDCILVKRTTVEQDVEAYESHKELGETQVVAQMLGVSDDSDLLDEDGKPLQSVDEKIEAYASAQGLVTEDGVVAITETNADGETVVKSAHGVVVDITKEKNADCTTSVTIRNTKEEKVSKSTVSAEVTARSIKTVTVDENVPAESGEDGATYPQVSVTGGVVTKKTVTKTKGGVRTIQTEKEQAVPIADGTGTKACEKTLFEHIDVTIAEAQDAANGELSDVTTDSGTHSKVQSTLRDDGKWDIQKTTTTELEVEDAVVHKTLTATQFVEDVTDKNSDTTETVLTTTTVRDGNKVYETNVALTPGGKKDVRQITRTPIKMDDTFVFNESATRRSTRTLYVRIFENAAKSDIATEQTADGKTYWLINDGYTDGSIRINEFGLYDGQLQYYDSSESDNDDGDPDNTEESWAVIPMSKSGFATLSGNTCKYSETWFEIIGYRKCSVKEIREHFKNIRMQSLGITPANRDRTEWSVRAETEHQVVYESISNSFMTIVGPDPQYTERQLEWQNIGDANAS